MNITEKIIEENKSYLASLIELKELKTVPGMTRKTFFTTDKTLISKLLDDKLTFDLLQIILMECEAFADDVLIELEIQEFKFSIVYKNLLTGKVIKSDVRRKNPEVNLDQFPKFWMLYVKKEDPHWTDKHSFNMVLCEPFKLS